MRHLDTIGCPAVAGPRSFPPAVPFSRQASARAPATCGELMYGHLDGEDFLVNCPIDRYAEARLHAVGMLGLHLPKASPPEHAARAIRLAAQRHEYRLAHTLRIRSTMAPGSGMGASTAEITAALGAWQAMADAELDAEELGALISAVGADNGTHHPGITLLNLRTGRPQACLPVPASLRVLVLDAGGRPEPTAFDPGLAREVYLAHRAEVHHIREMLLLGLNQQDLQLVGSAATASARLSQLILPKPALEELITLAFHAGALGVNCAHAGTLLGVLYDAVQSPGVPDRIKALLANGQQSHHLTVIGDHAIIGGGIRPTCSST